MGSRLAPRVHMLFLEPVGASGYDLPERLDGRSVRFKLKQVMALNV